MHESPKPDAVVTGSTFQAKLQDLAEKFVKRVALDFPDMSVSVNKLFLGKVGVHGAYPVEKFGQENTGKPVMSCSVNIGGVYLWGDILGENESFEGETILFVHPSHEPELLKNEDEVLRYAMEKHLLADTPAEVPGRSIGSLMDRD